MSNYMSARPPPSVAPDKGSFPLDHFGECKARMEVFMDCLKANNYSQRECRLESKEYLECRMANELMTVEDVVDLGFKDLIEEEAAQT